MSLFTVSPAVAAAGSSAGSVRNERHGARPAVCQPMGTFSRRPVSMRGGLFPLGILRPPPRDGQEVLRRPLLPDGPLQPRAASPSPARRSTSRAAPPGRPTTGSAGGASASVAHRNIAFFARYAFGTAPLVTINAFSMGAWAAGFNMSLGMMRHGIVKSIGPDLDKILSTLTVLGPTLPLPDLGLPAVPQAPPRRG